MERSHVVLALFLTAVFLVSGSGHADSTKGVDDPAVRADAGAKARPARVAAPSEATVNINTADVKGLMTLTGVNRKAAERIVAYRQAHGPFKKPEDIKRVDGVGERVWEKNRERIAIR